MSASIFPRVLLALLLLLGPCWAKDEVLSACKDTTELQQRIEKVLLENKVPGASVVLANRGGVIWVAGLGKSDVALGQATTPDTLFRIGSITKMWAGLAALKLQSEGRLDLQAPLRSLAPEIRFENSWEERHPVRIIHLLEHTTGWDDWRLREYAHSDPKPIDLREGLDFYPRSRTSRWQPGTRYAYCNSGPAVVAYLVQKITGQDFEAYVKEHFFKPMGMDTASFRLDSLTEQRLTKLYHQDGKTPFPYWHALMRPMGAINASAKDMGQALRFFLNRGTLDGRVILPPGALDRMETPSSSLGARAGLKIGYGIHNFAAQDDNGFAWYGHDGAVEGGISRLAYLPEAGVGYFISFNAANGDAFTAVRKLIRAYLIKDLPRPALPQVHALSPSVATTYQGWYLPSNPRRQDMAFLDYLGVARLRIQGSRLTVNYVLGDKSTYLAVSDTLFRKEKHAAASFALLPPGPDGIQFHGEELGRRIPASLAWMILIFVGFFLFSLLGTLLFALVWIPRLVFRRMKQVRHLSLRIWPLLAILCLMAPLVLIDENALQNLGRPSLVSWSLCLISLFYAFASVTGLWKALHTPREEVKRGVWIQAVIASGTFTLVAIFLAWHGVIGIRTWS